MNELEIIRHQIATERQHVAEVASACARLLDGGALQGVAAQAGLEYLAFTLTRLEAGAAREGQAKLEAVRAGGSQGSASTQGPAGAQPPAAQRPYGAQDSSERWRDFLQFFDGEWRRHLDALDAATSRTLHIKEWRAIAKIDADSIYEERQRYECVKAAGL
jgi:hypothetical protein